LKIISAEFVTSAAAGGASTGIPRDGLLQVAMTGRSNVGKSTLINALARRPIARTSAAPGKTRLANVYRLTVEGHRPGRWGLYLVDLPGYGYARGGASAAEELRAVAEAYFRGAGERPRPEQGGESAVRDSGFGIRGGRLETPSGREHPEPLAPSPGPRTVTVLLLVDARHPGLEADIQAHEWLGSLGVEPLVVATKIDKLSRAERTRNLRDVEQMFGKPALPVSAERGEGMDELWKTIASKARAAERNRKAADE
jgi:GTP-binding protein